MERQQEKKTEHYIKFRITKWNCLDDVVKLLHSYDKFFMVSENEKTNHHYQGMVICKTKKPSLSKPQVDNFRRKLKKSQGLQGNKDFSIGEITETPEKYLRYLCKGGGEKSPPVVVCNNILLEDAVRLNAQMFWKENNLLKTNDGKKKFHKIRDFKLSQEWLEKLGNKFDAIWAMKIILYHNENNLLIPDNYQIKKMVTTYLLKDDKNAPRSAYRMALKMYDYDINLPPYQNIDIYDTDEL